MVTCSNDKELSKKENKKEKANEMHQQKDDITDLCKVIESSNVNDNKIESQFRNNIKKLESLLLFKRKNNDVEECIYNKVDNGK